MFLDRDGTLIVERHYLGDPAGVELEADAGFALARLQRAGWLLVVITNQSGIGRGYLTWEMADSVNATTCMLLRREGVTIDAIYVCPHEPLDRCVCRKPRPGLLLEAAADLNIDLMRSFVIGDKRSDLEAAMRAGSAGLLVTTGHGRYDQSWAKAAGHTVVGGLAEAACLILNRAQS